MMTTRSYCKAETRRLRGDHGQVLLIVVVGIALLFAFAGLVLDGGRMYYEKRRMQIAADAGALGGAWEVVRRHTDLATEIRPAAVNDTSHNGYSNANSTITVNYPPASGPQAANNRFVEVIIERQVPTTFMRVLNFTQTTVRARAVAGA